MTALTYSSCDSLKCGVHKTQFHSHVLRKEITRNHPDIFSLNILLSITAPSKRVSSQLLQVIPGVAGTQSLVLFHKQQSSNWGREERSQNLNKLLKKLQEYAKEEKIFFCARMKEATVSTSQGIEFRLSGVELFLCNQEEECAVCRPAGTGWILPALLPLQSK